MKKRGVFIFILLLISTFVLSSVASAAVDKVRCILWQGDTGKYHTAISGEASADPLAAWSTTSDNELQVVYPGGGTYVSWIRVVVTVGSTSNTYCVYDYAGGGCTEENLCTAQYSASAFNQSVTIPAGPKPDSIVFEIVNTCGSGEEYDVFLNGTAMGSMVANENNSCTCTPGIQTSVPGQSNDSAALLKGVITATNTDPIWVKWDFGDGNDSSVVQLSGNTKYNVEIEHTYVGAVGTPFEAQLKVDAVSDAMTNAITDKYLVKIEENNLDARVNIAIDKGLWRLYKNTVFSDGLSGTYQTLNSQPCAIWNYSSYYSSATATTIQAFMINNHKETGNFSEDPYAEGVKFGINWILNGSLNGTSPILRAINVSGAQNGQYAEDYNNDGILDAADIAMGANTIGIDTADSNSPYQVGAVMDALITTGTPNADSGRDFDGDGSTDTYKEVVQDLLDTYSWGQEDAGFYMGGWRYGWNYGSADNSISQWAAIGIIPAVDNWECLVPTWVKTRNMSWLNNSYTTFDSDTHGRFGYASSSCIVSSGSGCHATTPSGMIQMIMNGLTTSDSKWEQCEQWLADDWNTYLNNSYQMYGFYALAKAMRLALPTAVETFSSNGFNWYRGSSTQKGLAERLLEIQQADGTWNGGWATGSISTAWGVIILRPAIFAAAPTACFTAHPNPNYPDQPINFDPSCSDHSETGKNISNLTKFEWDFDNNGVYEISTTTPSVVSYSFPCASIPCTYPVTLRVTDDSDPALQDTESLDIIISNPPHPPVANAGGPYMVSLCDGDTLILDGSASYDPNDGQHEDGCATCPDDTIISWNWDYFGAPFNYTDGSGQTVAPNYTEAGTYNVGLKVEDNTKLSYPNANLENYTDENFTKVTVYDACACNLAARIKSGKVQLTWTATGAASYDIYRSTLGPNTGFSLIANDHVAVTTTAVYLDTNVVNGTTYYYRVVSSDGCGSKAVMATPRTR